MAGKCYQNVCVECRMQTCVIVRLVMYSFSSLLILLSTAGELEAFFSQARNQKIPMKPKT